MEHFFKGMWGSHGFSDGQFSWPKGVTIDSGGNVYVADSGNFRIQKFTSKGMFLAKWGSLGSGDSQFGGPTAIAVDSNDDIYVSIKVVIV